jgi:signal peptidase I
MEKFSRGLFWTALVVGMLIGLARLTCIRWWHVPTNDPWLEASVSPSLRPGDWVLLWRLTEPSYGDLVLCPEPNAPRVVVGRIIAEGGDRIHLKDGNAWVNDRPVQSVRACNEPDFSVAHPQTGEAIEQRCAMRLAGSVLHESGELAGHEVRPMDMERKVGAGDVFLMSDNMLFPYDSRDYGMVARSTCKESVVFRLWDKAGFTASKRRLEFIR